jgi:murein DD-endopeptidase MepM/ murein hydrolase activator NlpD
MDTVLIKGGQRVKAGDVIGLMGDTGSPGSVHLHFEYWRSGGESDAVDPEDLIMRICRIGKGSPSDSAAAEPEPKPATEPVDDSVVGEVFSN